MSIVDVSRELFASHNISSNKVSPIKKPLSTITNDESFKFPKSVSEAQERIAKLQKRSVLLGQENYPRQIPTRDHVQAMKRQVREKISTPAKAPRSTINIPLNKVNELKKRLEESKMEELKKLESAQMNAKKRAEIKERVNTVQGLLKGLNDNIGNKSSLTTPSRELNLPRARVSEMKSWLKDFERENKAHADKWNLKSAGEGGVYIPRSGSRNQKFLASNDQKPSNGRDIQLENSDGRRVSELTEWLVDFGESNKAHFEKGSSRPYTVEPKTSKQVEDEVENFDEESEQFPNTEPADGVQDSMDQYSDTEAVENISMLQEETNNSPADLNVSMMPGVPHDGVDEENDGDNSDWDDDYQDLMMTVDIVQIESEDTWDKESVESPKESVQGESMNQFDAEEISEDEVEHQLDLVEEDEVGLLQQIDSYESNEDTVEKNAYIGEELSVDSEAYIGEELSVDSEQSEAEAEERNVLTFDCDDTISKMSFEGYPVDYITAKTNMPESNEYGVDDTNSPKSALFGENILNKTSEPVVSNSFCGHGLSDSMFVPPKNTTAIDRNKKQSGIRKLLGSLNCLKIHKTSKAAKSFANNIEDTNQHIPIPIHQKSSKSLFLSPDSHPDPDADVQQSSYLPQAYNRNINGDFARQMIMVEKGFGKARAAESPVSLASAYRRQLSPGSSCVSGFTDIETHVVKKEKHDIGQHVKHLQEIYGNPTIKSSKLYMF